MHCYQRSLSFCLLFLLGWHGHAAMLFAQTNTEFEKKTLEAMNDAMVKETLAAVTELNAWKNQATSVKKAVNDVIALVKTFPDANADKDQMEAWTKNAQQILQKTPQLNDIARQINKEVQSARDKNQEIAKIAEIYKSALVRGATQISMIWIRDVEQKMTAQFPKVKSFLDYGAALQMKLNAAKNNAGNALQLINYYEQEVLKSIDSLNDPAKFTQKLLEGEIAKLAQTPIKKGDVTFQITQRDKTKSIFSANAGMNIKVVYLDKINVEATGLYFKTDGTPVFDNVKLKSNLGSILSGVVLNKLGDAIPDLGGNSPMKLKYKDFLGFQKGDKGRRGGIKFDLEISFVDFLPKLKAENLVLFTDGHVDFDSKDGLIKAPVADKIALGTSGLGLYNFTIGLNPKGKKASIEGDISTFPGDPKALRVNAQISFDIPVSKVEYKGDLRFADQVLGEVTDGVISEKIIKGTLLLPGKKGNLPVDALIRGKASFELTREAFKAEGDFALLKTFEQKLKLHEGFNGKGWFEASKNLRILGAQASYTFSGSHSPGFKNINLTAMVSTEINLGILKPSVSVKITGDNSRAKPFHVQAKALGARVEFELDDFGNLDAELRRALREKLPDMVENVLKEMAEWDKQARGALADAEKQFRNELHNAAKQVGVDALRTGNEQADKFLGQISDGGKELGGIMSDQGKRIGGELSKAVKNPVGAVQMGAQEVLGAISGIFGGGGRSDRSAAIAAERKARQEKELHEAINKKVNNLLVAISRHKGIHEVQNQTHGHGSNRLSRRSELYLNFGEAVAGAAKNSKTDAVVAFTIKVSGFQSNIGAKSGSARQQTFDANVHSGTVYIKNLAPSEKDKKRPSAKINISRLQHGSSFPAEQIAHDEIQKLIELHLPDVDIEGNLLREEKKLALHNKTDENIKVSVQIESRDVKNAKFVWNWHPGAKPGPQARTYSFYLKPNQEMLLREDLSSEKPGGNAPTSSSGSSKITKDITKGINKAKEAVQDAIDDLELDVLKGRSVRIWAESESGRTWSTYKDSDLQIVKRNSKGKREYRSEKIGTYTYGLKPRKGPRVFHERLLRFHNETDKTVIVTGEIFTKPAFANTAQWQRLPKIEVPAGKSLTVRRDDDWIVRGSKLRFSAENQDRTQRWEKYKQQELDLVNEEGYRAENIGTYLQTFQRLSAGSTDGNKSSNNRR